MAKAWCPHCDEHGTGVDPKLTNKRQRFIVHVNKKKQPVKACDGSGEDI